MAREVEVAVLPKCQTHGLLFPKDTTVPDAAVDGRTQMGPWANMCEECHAVLGVGLGIGKGQRLKLKEGS